MPFTLHGGWIDSVCHSAVVVYVIDCIFLFAGIVCAGTSHDGAELPVQLLAAASYVLHVLLTTFSPASSDDHVLRVVAYSLQQLLPLATPHTHHGQ